VTNAQKALETQGMQQPLWSSFFVPQNIGYPKNRFAVSPIAKRFLVVHFLSLAQWRACILLD